MISKQTKEVTRYQYQFKEESVFFYQEEKVGETPKNILVLKQEDTYHVTCDDGNQITEHQLTSNNVIAQMIKEPRIYEVVDIIFEMLDVILFEIESRFREHSQLMSDFWDIYNGADDYIIVEEEVSDIISNLFGTTKHYQKNRT